MWRYGQAGVAAVNRLENAALPFASDNANVPENLCGLRENDATMTSISTDIPQIAAGSLANLLRFRVSGKPAPLARFRIGMGSAGVMPRVELC
jgi:hypothetical protein